MTKKLKLVLFALTVSAVALAAREPTVDLISSLFPQWFQSGYYVGTGTINPVQSTTNKVVKLLASDFSPWDFPPLATGALNSLNQTCAETDPVTLTGAEPGDLCEATSNFGLDAGLSLPTNAVLTCHARTNAVVGRLCIAYNTDGGTLSLADAGYRYFLRK